MGAAVDSVRFLIRRDGDAEHPPLDPKFAYLRVTRGSHVGLLWRGSTERSPEGPVEVYYSSGGEVLRLRDGRLVGALGLFTEWRQVTDSAPAWQDIVAAAQPVTFVRARDVMPGYRSGVRDELVLRRTVAPMRTAMRGVDPTSLAWFEESLREHGGLRVPRTADAGLPPARYALNVSGAQPAVVYSEQCLARDLCFTWQRWNAAMQRALLKPQ
jgi:hypothetical protein